MAAGSPPGHVAEAFFINLDSASDRRDFMLRQAEVHALRLQRFRALTAADVDEREFDRLSRRWERPMTRIEFAVFCSHRALWKRAAGSGAGLVILEDDVALSPRLASVMAAPPEGFDLVNLEYFDRRKFMARSSERAAGPVRLTAVARDKAGAAAYYLSPAGAFRLLAMAHARAAPADAYMFSIASLRMAQAEPALAVQAHVLAARGLDAGIRTATSIHSPRKRLGPQPRNSLFHVRRATAQARLGFYHLRRLVDLTFRKPDLDEEEFRRILPVRLTATPRPPDQEAHSSS